MSLVDEVLTKSTELLRRRSLTSNLLNRLSRSESSGSLNIPTKACSICATETDTALYPDLSLIPSTCQAHCSDVCTSCFRLCLEAATAEKPIHHIGCPTCDVGWDKSFLEQWVIEAELEPYDSRKTMQDLETDPDFRKCQSLTCPSGNLHSGGEEEPVMTCVACGVVSCYTHNVPWHAGVSSTEYDNMIGGESEKQKSTRIAEEEALYQQTFTKDRKPCPVCKVSVFRESECDIMRCTNCKLSFCWPCGIDMNPIESGITDSKTHICPLYDDGDPKDHYAVPSTSSSLASPIPCPSLSTSASPSASPSPSLLQSPSSPPRSSSLGPLISSLFAAAALKPSSSRRVKKREGGQRENKSPTTLFPVTPPRSLNHMKLEWEKWCSGCGTITTTCKHKKGKGENEELETSDDEAMKRQWWKVKSGTR